MKQKKDILVEVLGQNYTIKTTADKNYIDKVANYVNSTMKELKNSGMDPKTEQLRIAILACMNIADELFKEKESKYSENQLLDRIKSKTISLKEYVDQQILSFEKRNETGE
ncbi:MAG: hypothetical protein CMG00_05195 [Candidatus Marinimicrobia bacterium]|nr:hypothetical protein [Candidatus Neomarinimicrobiota bacterium]|tara:strand:- start:1289 stop:1621 length:333 start_codon:yes stop_codon:yes gene_type:complete